MRFTKSLFSGFIAASLSLGLLAGCPDGNHGVPDGGGPVDGDGGPDAQTPSTCGADAGGQRNLDILFLVDNSGSMGEEQQSLANNFPTFMAVLNNIEGGLPSVHIGVISSNAGVGGFQINGCAGNGDNGALQAVARQAGGSCTPPVGKFIQDIVAADGSRVKNYTGTLEDTFSCISQLGTLGCGFEQHLESMKRALDGSNPDNAGFLREDADLAVIIIADEDDCSAKDPAMFDPSDTTLTSTLGPLRSFRCTEFGVTCAEGNIDRDPGTYSECRPRTNSFLRDPHEYAQFLKGLKCDPNRILVAGIIGNTDPVIVKRNTEDEPELGHSCMDPSGVNGAADPGIRLKAFLDEFPESVTTSICNNDLSPALQKIAERLARR